VSISDIQNKDSILKAINEFEQLGRNVFLKKYGFRKSREYFIELNGKFYDSKAIVAVAFGYEFPNKGVLKSFDFSGGEKTVEKKLIELGFTVKRIRANSSDAPNFKKHFSNIMNNYIEAKKDIEIRRKIESYFKELTSDLEKLSFIKNNSNLFLRYGYGIGRMANVPWLALFDRRETDTAKSGVYPVYLFKSDMSGVYLTLNQGIGAGEKHSPSKKDLEKIHENTVLIRNETQTLIQKGFFSDDNVFLADSGAGKGYEKSTVSYKLYEKNNFPSNIELLNDLKILLDFYTNYVDEKVHSSNTNFTTDKLETEPENMSPQTEYTIDKFISETGYGRTEIHTWRHLLSKKKQIIFQGPPGTGKTFVAKKLAKLFVSNTKGFIELIQFHPSYTYEDFIQGYRPESVNGNISFNMKKGHFLDFCEKASEIKDPCVMIIDEINRANIARVFGELMFLLEYRDEIVPLASGETLFKIPENVFIIGTMNTADRSIALVDHALRRRFGFIRLKPKYDVLERKLIDNDYPARSLIKTLKEINHVIDDINYEIGISYFIKNIEKLGEELPIIWVTEIEPYLEEFFYDQQDKVRAYTWEVLSKNSLSEWVNYV